ncbi:MAG: hypothetical protein KDB65_03725 [Calditrichaeota bacterium]|nr:hypothetical protein [Calditrichota bacterium]MCB9368770.1 hypothetical protein [Calditrichota bacterium]
MKRVLVSLILAGVLASVAWAGVEVLSLSVYPLGDHARVEWRTGQEIDFQKFVVERSPDGTNFFPVGQISARGSFSEYSFTDESPLDDERGRSFFYRLKTLNNDGTFGYTEIIEVSLNFSAVQQTWGSIKAMFR